MRYITIYYKTLVQTKHNSSLCNDCNDCSSDVNYVKGKLYSRCVNTLSTTVKIKSFNIMLNKHHRIILLLSLPTFWFDSYC